MKPVFFETPADLRTWFEANHQTANELWVGYYKTSLKRKGITWQQSVDEALCFGWIDSVRKSVDESSYCNRFTPRKPRSNWSEINIAKVKQLTAEGRMHSSGLKLFEERKIKHPGVYSYENKPENLPEYMQEILKTNDAALAFYNSCPPSYRRTALFWILSARQEQTRLSRLDKFIQLCAEGKRMYI